MHRRRLCRFRRSSATPVLKHKALIIGINYTDDREHDFRPLKGPNNDAKDVKKTLIELFNYKEEDICLMTDEEENINTALWPSEENIVKALRDLVHNASPGDAFVFFYAGHSGQQPATVDPNEIDGLDEYIVTCDYKIILDNTLRQYLVDPLPEGSRLTAILDTCHSGTLLDLDHYSCHWFLRRQTLSLQQKAVTKYKEPTRRHTDDVGLVRGATQLLRMTFSSAVTAMLAIVRLKVCLKTREQVKEDADDATPQIPGLIPQRPPCGGWYCAYALLNGPLVISVSSCADHERTWEDSQNRGRSMTTKLIKILNKNPCIKVCDLNQQLKKKLSKIAFKRVLNARKAFRKFSARLPPEQREKWEAEFTEKGLFELREQTAQIGSMHRLRRDDLFIAKRTRTIDL